MSEIVEGTAFSGDRSLEEMFQAGRGYDLDRQKWHDDKVRIWKTVAIFASLLLALAMSLAVFLPRVTEYVPYIVRVDNSTGIVDTATRVVDGKTSYEEAVNNFFIAKYIQCFESYHRDTYKKQYEECALYTPKTNVSGLLARFNSKDEKSSFALYGEHGSAQIGFKYFKPTNEDGKYEAHFTLTQKIGDEVKVNHYVASVKFTFNSGLMRQSERLVNPLGFQVLSYRPDMENVK